MSEAQSKAQRKRHEREHVEKCPTCFGKGYVDSRSPDTRARQGGVGRYLKSLRKGEESMSDMGRKGGRPRLPTAEELGIDVRKE